VRLNLKTADDVTADGRRWTQINEIKRFLLGKGFARRVNVTESGIFLHRFYPRLSAVLFIAGVGLKQGRPPVWSFSLFFLFLFLFIFLPGTGSKAGEKEER
jgi:hypothetical protein